MATLYSYDLQGKKDSFANWISNISPTDTFIVSGSKKESTPQPRYKWQTDSLFPSIYDTNFVDNILEGAVTPSPDKIAMVSAVEKVGNTQIFTKTFQISDSALATSTHGRSGELKYQLEKAGKELKNVMEVVFSSKQVRAVSAPGVAPKTDGLFSQIAAKNLANPGLPTVTPDDTAVHIESAATTVAIADFEKVMYALYKSGSKACVILANPTQAININKVALDFGKEIVQLQTFEKYDAEASDHGKAGLDEQNSITDRRGKIWCICYSRFVPVDVIYFLHPEDLTQRVLREPKASQMGKQGASEVWQLTIEAGLCLSNPFAAGVIEIKP